MQQSFGALETLNVDRSRQQVSNEVLHVTFGVTVEKLWVFLDFSQSLGKVSNEVLHVTFGVTVEKLWVFLDFSQSLGMLSATTNVRKLPKDNQFEKL